MSQNEELKKKMICGDWIVVGKMLNISAKNARISFTRPDSKRYTAIIEAIEKVIKNREDILTNPNKKDESNQF